MVLKEGLPVFSFLNKLNSAETKKLYSLASRQQVKKNEYIFQASQANNSIYLLLDGKVKLSRISSVGREFIQWFIFPGDVFGFSENIANKQRDLFAQALTDISILGISKPDFNRFLLDHPRVALLIVNLLSGRVRALGNMLLHVTGDDAHTRMVNLLDRLSTAYGRKSKDQVVIDLNLTHQEMADMIGVCRQTVSSLMGKFKRQGLLDSNRKGILIKQPIKLGEMALTEC